MGADEVGAQFSILTHHVGQSFEDGRGLAVESLEVTDLSDDFVGIDVDGAITGMSGSLGPSGNRCKREQEKAGNVINPIFLSRREGLCIVSGRRS